MLGPKDNPTIPLKKNLSLKYGGYKSVTPAYFALVESVDRKGNKRRSIETVPLYRAKEFEKNVIAFEEYCKEKCELNNPKVIIPKIKKDMLFIIDGYPMHLRGNSDKRLVMQNAVQLKLTEKMQKYVKRIEKYITNNNLRKDKKALLPIRISEGITQEENLCLYDILLDKQQNTIYCKRPASQVELLLNKRENFISCTLEEQCIVLNEILCLLQCKPVTADLRLIGGSKNAGSFKISKFITGCKNAVMVNQSVTGLFKQEIDLLTVKL